MFLFGFCLLVISKNSLNIYFLNGNTVAFLNTRSLFLYDYFRFSIHIKSLKHLPDQELLAAWMAKIISARFDGMAGCHAHVLEPFCFM